ncbi:MAG: DUF2188 domain-containing protein [Syntrophothermus sp.]
MPKDIDPHGTIKLNDRWAKKGKKNTKAETKESKQKELLEKAREIAKKKK